MRGKIWSQLYIQRGQSEVVAGPGCHLIMTPYMAVPAWSPLVIGKSDLDSSQGEWFCVYPVVAVQTADV